MTPEVNLVTGRGWRCRGTGNRVRGADGCLILSKWSWQIMQEQLIWISYMTWSSEPAKVGVTCPCRGFIESKFHKVVKNV